MFSDIFQRFQNFGTIFSIYSVDMATKHIYSVVDMATKTH